MWKNVRILVLLLVLLGVALHSWFDRRATQSWKEPLWVGIFPLNADGTDVAQHYLATLRPKDFTGIEEFMAREARRYGVPLDQPVHVELYPQGVELPPTLARNAGPLGTAWWSLKLRWYASREAQVPGRAPPRVRLFVLFHDPATLDHVPDSHGLQKGLVGVVHVFAQAAMAGSNNIVIAHELMHTLGASDKYDLGSGAPLYPLGFAAPHQQPLYPQAQAEIMAGRRALAPHEFDMPATLGEVIVGPATALEIRWTQP
jgi:hypothetical protein